MSLYNHRAILHLEADWKVSIQWVLTGVWQHLKAAKTITIVPLRDPISNLWLLNGTMTSEWMILECIGLLDEVKECGFWAMSI